MIDKIRGYVYCALRTMTPNTDEMVKQPGVDNECNLCKELDKSPVEVAQEVVDKL